MPGQDETYAHGDLLDWYVDGDESAVFVENQVIVMSAAATTILQVIGEEAASSSDIGAALVKRFGPPEGSTEEAVTAMVQDLVQAGVLRVVDQGRPSAR